MDTLPPPVVQLLDHVRELYVDWLAGVTSLPQFEQKKLEAEWVDADGRFLPQGRLQLPFRSDFFASTDGRPESANTVASGEVIRFTPFEFTLFGATIDMNPFTWDDLVVEADLGPGRSSDRVVADWYRIAFVAQPSKDDRWKHAVHFVSDPQPFHGGIRFEVDLGTAPPGDLTDLLRRLAEAGATHIRLSDEPLKSEK